MRGIYGNTKDEIDEYIRQERARLGREGPSASRRLGLAEHLLLRSSRTLLLDTNVLIYFLGGEQPFFDELVPVFRRVQAGEAHAVISVITEAELLVRPERDDNAMAQAANR